MSVGVHQIHTHVAEDGTITRRMPAGTPAWREAFDRGFHQAKILQNPSAVFRLPEGGWISVDARATHLRRKQN